MIIDATVKVLFDVPGLIIDNFLQECSTVDWSSSELTRDDSLVSRTIRIPFNYRKDPDYEVTDQVLRIQNYFKSQIEPWLQEKFPDRILFKGEINYIMPGVTLPFHVDPSWLHEHSSRIHIPILTNEKAFWVTETELVHMPVGYAYEVNNRKLHSYWNNGKTGRLHIVVDVMDLNIYNDAISKKIDFNQKTADPNATMPEEIFLRNKWYP